MIFFGVVLTNLKIFQGSVSQETCQKKYRDMAAIRLIDKTMLFVVFVAARGLDSAAHYSTQTNK